METRSQRVEETMGYLDMMSELAELRKDKARLDFLLGENHPIAIEVEITFGGDEKKLYYLEDRESIDKAMRGEPIY